MKALFELFRRFDARRIFGLIRRLGGMSRPKVKCYDLRSTHALRMEGDIKGFRKKVIVYQISIHAFRVEGDYTSPSPEEPETEFLSTPSGWRATQKRTKFSSVFAQKGEEFASLRREKRKFAGGVLKRTNFGF